MEAKFNKRAMHKQYMKRSHNVLDPRFSPTATYPAGQNPPPATNSPSQTVVTPILGPPETVTQNGGPNPPPTSTPAQQPPPPPPTSKSSSPLLPPLLPTTSSSSTSAPPTTTSSTTPSTSAVPSTTATTPPPVASTTPVIQPSNTYSWTVPSISELATSSPTASASSTAAANSGVSTGAIVGGIAAAGVAIAGIVFAALFFIRRSRRLSENEFNAAAFRRQSAILIDDAASDRWNPRPPTMIERKMNNAPPSASGYGQQQYAGLGAYGNGYNNYEQSSFSPGQVMPTSSSPPPANPMYTGYGQSPVGSPTSPAPYESAYNEYGQLTRQPSNGAYLNRQPSNGPYPNLSRQPSNGPYPNLARQNSFGAQALAGYDPVVPNASANPNAHYVDLSRSSVTPFQAAQYAEISRRLNDDPSKPTQHSSLALTAVSEETAVEPGVAPVEGKVYSDYASYAKQIGMDHQHLALPAAAEEPSSPIESPFADPAGARQLRAVNGDEDEDHVIGVATTTSDSDSAPALIRTPSPAQTRTRVTSNPPMLPELNVPNRAFSPMAVSSSFHVPAALQAGLAVPAPAASGTPMRRENVSTVEKRPDTTYDEADAYGGI